MDQLIGAADVASPRHAFRDERGQSPRHRTPNRITPRADDAADGLLGGGRERATTLAGIAHELRNPLTNLEGYLQAMQDGVIAPSGEVFSSLREEVQRLHRLTRVLDLVASASRPAAPESGPVDLVRLIDEAVTLCRTRFDIRELHFERRLPDAALARGDRDNLMQVLLNLLQNAERYTPQGGMVEIRVVALPDVLRVVVSNSGEGIPAQEAAHLYKPFFRGRACGATEGRGLGLSIVRQLVEAGGGTVGLASATDMNHFWFTVPAAAATSKSHE